MYKLKITLKSDICVGSGFSYAGIIDSDSVFDDRGLPYIPARRIKGCLRESCSLIDIPKDYIDIIFGVSGNNKSESIIMYNAYLPYYEEISSNISCLKDEYAKLLSTQAVLNEYSTIKAQTAIGNNGVAENGSLRFVRTIKHYDPIEEGEMCFYAKVSFDNLPNYVDKQEVYNYLEKLAKATRNIGLQRNRGLGSVKMELIEENDDDLTCMKLSDNACGFEYVVENISPLILSDIDVSSTSNYIKGSNILGALAKEYLKNNEADDEFSDLFLSGKVIFSNLYIAELFKDKWYRSYPAPLNVNKLKKTKKLVDLSFKHEDEDVEEDYQMKGGNQAKKLKNKNIIKFDDGYKVVEAITELAYHHSHSGINKKNEEGLLYYLDAISKGQFFKGYIYGEPEHLKKVLDLLTRASLSLGKSKCAQYGSCRLVKNGIKEIYKSEHNNKLEPEFKNGDLIQVKFISDGILMDENGNYVTNYEKAKNIVAKQLGLIVGDCDEMSIVKNNVITGYLGTWNLQKSQVPAIKAGSVFTYMLKDSFNSDIKYIGERNIDGFGEILVEKKHDAFALDEHEESCSIEYKVPIEKTKIILKNVLLNNLYLRLVKDKQSVDSIKITSSSLGRLTLMLIESVNEKNYSSDIEEEVLSILAGLKNRINSIKSNEKRDEIYGYLNEVLNFDVKNDRSFTKLAFYKQKEGKKVCEYEYPEYSLLKEVVSKKEADKLIAKLCVPLLKDILAFEKYRKKG